MDTTKYKANPSSNWPIVVASLGAKWVIPANKVIMTNIFIMGNALERFLCPGPFQGIFHDDYFSYRDFICRSHPTVGGMYQGPSLLALPPSRAG
jgi:hypothetical protein